MSKHSSAPADLSVNWERSDFPIVCETCLGDNPYVRMMKSEYEKECKICARPFTVFRWRPGSNARYKKTEICQTCAKLKNVCQTCLLDLEYGLPVQVRDSAMPGGTTSAIPQSDINREWFADQAERQLANGGVNQFDRIEQRAALNKLARSQPYYKRNMAHVCSFFLKGTCTRGSECPYRHEIPNKEEKDPELANQNMKDRYHGVNDPVARKMINRLGGSGLAPPADINIKTLYVGGVNPSVTSEEDIKGALYAYGEIMEVKMPTTQNFAFVTFTTREGAEKAIQKVGGNFTVNGATLRLAWKKPSAVDANLTKAAMNQPISTSSTTSASKSPFGAPPPPGPGARATQYASQNPALFGSQKSDR